MSTPNCLRCHTPLRFLKREKIQLGQSGAFFGDWPNIIAGALDAEIFYCPTCGHIELFMPGMNREAACPDDDAQELPPEEDANIVGVSMHGVPQVQCPHCGKRHDFDYPKCPWCDHVY